jgi:hypothetical protein
LLSASRAAGGHVDARSIAPRIERRQGLVTAQEEDIVRLRDHPAGGERLADPQHSPSHGRPSERELADLLLTQWDEMLCIGEHLAKGSKTARGRSERREGCLLCGLPRLDQLSMICGRSGR